MSWWVIAQSLHSEENNLIFDFSRKELRWRRKTTEQKTDG